MDQPHHARELAARQLQALDQIALGAAEHRVARGLEPARRGRAVGTVQRRELIDAQAIEDMLAQDRALGERVAPTSAAHLSIEAKRDRLDETLRRNNGNKTAAARELGVTRKTIHKWLAD